jgi:hypothetical protein
MKCLMLLVVMACLPRIEAGDVGSSVPESSCQSEKKASSPQVGSFVGEVLFEPPSLISGNRMSQIAGRRSMHRAPMSCW